MQGPYSFRRPESCTPEAPKTVYFSVRHPDSQAEKGGTMGKFEIFKDSQGEFRWRLRAANGEVIASGEGYTSKAGCLNGIESVRENAPIAEIDDQTE